MKFQSTTLILGRVFNQLVMNFFSKIRRKPSLQYGREYQAKSPKMY